MRAWDLTASDHIRALYKHARHEFFDYALVNRTPASAALAAKYAEQQQSQIEPDVDQIEALGVKPVLGEYLMEEMRSATAWSPATTRTRLRKTAA